MTPEDMEKGLILSLKCLQLILINMDWQQELLETGTKVIKETNAFITKHSGPAIHLATTIPSEGN